ncbi:MAG: hypothetical protein H6Q13_3469 [Bacteroidetes bacterium]|nr:hypothetical protein [Bacteroidota bacterium]
MKFYLAGMSDEQLVQCVKSEIALYQEERVAKNCSNLDSYPTVKSKDLNDYGKALQRVWTDESFQLREQIESILQNDFGLKQQEEKKSVKSVYEALQEQNGMGRYHNELGIYRNGFTR